MPNPRLPSKNKADSEAGLRVADPRAYNAKLEKVRVLVEDIPAATTGPGLMLGLLDQHSRLTEYREKFEKKVPLTGIRFENDGTPVITDVPNPQDKAWDPFQFMPRFLFDPGEDAFPVAPAFDGDGNLDNNAPSKPNGVGGNYRDGVIEDRQALSGGFAVTRKGDYTVLTYSFYYPHNKAGDYHTKDWSIAQVYLRPGKDGKLQPESLYTSWHHGGMLTPWDKLLKDEQGKPVIQVGLGSHSLTPLGLKDSLPERGLQILGNGAAQWNDKPLPNRLSLDSFQKNVQTAFLLEPGSDAFKTRLLMMRYGYVGFDPLMPEVFAEQGGVAKAIEEKAAGYASRALEKLKETWKKLFD
ncbi:MAG TPA: hypothetical protein DD435_13320 [Cyanobacteria bacterium UBA8530]|nr:hypothetical protein [Cyanobacteria bacterium UBA8530]